MFDHLGTTKILVNEKGNITWPRPGKETNKLLPFGILRPFSKENAGDMDFDPLNPDPNEAAYKLTFTNKEIDHQLDLHYFGARYYHANLPRFISPDPVGGKLTIPISWNRYLYCQNDPVNMIDPDGENPWVIAASGLLGGSIGYLVDKESPMRGMIAGFAGGAVTAATYQPELGVFVSGFVAGIWGGVVREATEAIVSMVDNNDSTEPQSLGDAAADVLITAFVDGVGSALITTCPGIKEGAKEISSLYMGAATGGGSIIESSADKIDDQTKDIALESLTTEDMQRNP